jgi:micrococcal nuclease
VSFFKILFFLIILGFQCFALEIPVTIQSVKDGDTLSVMYYELPLTVRMEHIDAPEKKQLRGPEAAAALRALTVGKTATLNFETQDRYGRYVGIIMINGKNINAEMVRLGWAWWYHSYSDDGHYQQLEATARKGRLGVWADKAPTAPWDWRRNKVKVLD